MPVAIRLLPLRRRSKPPRFNSAFIDSFRSQAQTEARLLLAVFGHGLYHGRIHWFVGLVGSPLG